MVKNLSKQDLEWQAQSDARVMAQYQEILSDKSRMNRAIKEANKQASDLSKQADVMRNAAKAKFTGSKSTSRKK